MGAIVTAVSCSRDHTFKPNVLTIRLVAGLGVEGDAQLGEKVKHRSRVRENPDDPNLRQVHLISFTTSCSPSCAPPDSKSRPAQSARTSRPAASIVSACPPGCAWGPRW